MRGFADDGKKDGLFMPGVMNGHAPGADTVAESGVGSLGYVMFDGVPIALIVPDLLAMHADGDDAFQCFDSILIRLDRIRDQYEDDDGDDGAHQQIGEKGLENGTDDAPLSLFYNEKHIEFLDITDVCVNAFPVVVVAECVFFVG